METVKVAGHDGLRKDLNSNAIVNADTTAFARAKEQKRLRLLELKRVDDLENKLEQLETLLKKLLEGDN